MTGKIFTVLSILTAVLAIGTYARFRQIEANHVPQGVQSTGFDEIAPGLYRFGRTWNLVKTVLEVHISTFMIKNREDFILIDSGLPTASYIDHLIPAVKAATKNGTLRLILLTHGHTDHIGGLPALLDAFPETQVVMHILEAPYAGGGVSYAAVPADNWVYTITRRLLPPDNLHLPVHRLLFLAGEHGDVSEAKGAAGQALAWTPPAGLLEYVLVPGHAPGQLAFLHRPSSSLLPADVICNLGSSGAFFGSAKPASLGLPPPGSSSNWTQHALDWSALAQLNFTTAFPSHDIGTGVPRAAIVKFAEKLAPMKASL